MKTQLTKFMTKFTFKNDGCLLFPGLVFFQPGSFSSSEEYFTLKGTKGLLEVASTCSMGNSRLIANLIAKKFESRCLFWGI